MSTGSPILRIALPTPLRRLFDYLPPQDFDLTKITPGSRVAVPFQSRTLVGILISIESESSVPTKKLKQAITVLDHAPILPDDVYKLCHWAADYYHYALGEVLSAALPTWLRKGKESTIETKLKKPSRHEAPMLPTLNDAQQQAVTAITNAANTFKAFLLDGVTGSGKTEVYLRAINEVLANGQQVLVLVPEISLTPQTVARFKTRFNVPIVTLHSSVSEKAKFVAWSAAKSNEAKIVIGTRSAIFTPFHHLGLIIVDEEHDTSFKQQDRFRYHARDLAIMRANLNHIPIVLGSATPSLETLLNVKRKRYDYLSLPERAGVAELPQFQLIDIKQSKLEDGLSAPLLQAMQDHLSQGNQVMLFLNRRGFAPVLYCTNCAWMVGCKRCDARMVYHRSPVKLQCHHCDTFSVIPKCCEKCGGTNMQPVGVGTQRLEQTLANHFPDVPIIRVDRDSTRKKGAMQAMLEQIHQQPKAILLGTQMLAKGHHFPQVTLVGMIDADSGLFSADFRAAEQMGQLLLQVSGRAGREEKRGTVVIQTRHPNHPLLQLLIQKGYHSFSQTLLGEREQALLPPFSYFAVFRAESRAEQQASDFLTSIKQLFDEFNQVVTVLGPVPAMMAKRKGLYCQHLLLKTNKRSALQQFLKTILEKIEANPLSHSVKWLLDVDPVEV